MLNPEPAQDIGIRTAGQRFLIQVLAKHSGRYHHLTVVLNDGL